jgi:formate-dependent nitrite reductase membrane component NrfD
MGLFDNPRSVMTLGVYLLTVYAPLTIVVAVLELMKRKVPSWLVWVGSILAVGVAMYTGFLLGVLDTYPLWNSAVLPVLFLASALSSGSAACGLIAMFTDREAFEGMTSLKRYHVAIVVVEAVLLFTLVTIAASVSPEGAASVGMLVSGRYALPFWLGIIVLGLVLPLVSQGMSLSKPDSVSALGIMGEAGALIGGFLLRLLIILAALPVLFVM